MAKKATLALLFTCFFILLTACSTQDSGSANIEYEETKKMIVDILKTEDGKKALKEVLSDDEFKAQLAIDNTVVTDSIQATLVSDKGKEFWKKAFEDPEHLHNAPHKCAIGRPDETTAARNPILKYEFND